MVRTRASLSRIVVGCFGILLACGAPRSTSPPAARAPVGASPAPAAIDVVLTGGKIFTADAARPWAEAIAIRHDRIAGVGSAAELRALPGVSPTTRIIDLGGRVVIPGLNDAHAHVPDTWAPHVAKVPSKDPTLDEAVAAVREAAATQPAGTWLIVRMGVGWYTDPRANRQLFDRVAPRHPVLTYDNGGHSKIVSSAGLAALGITETAADPPHGRYGRDPKTKRLDGWLHEYATYAAIRKLEEAHDDATIAEAADRLENDALRFGITSIQTMAGVSAERLAKVQAGRSPKLRWRIIRWPQAGIQERFEPTAASDRVRIHGVKYIVDGTPIERGAWLTQPYRDAPRDRGRSNFSNEELQRIVAIADETSEPLLLHAVGDAAIEQILSTLERQAPAERWRSRRVRIEHGDLFTPAQLQRAAKLGVILVQNPVHFLLPELLAKRLGTCGTGCQPLKSAAHAGVAIAIGSDGPLNPFLGIMAATVHPTTPAEALSREDAVIAYTRGAAFAELAESDKGTIAIGKLADLAVLSQDIFTIAPDQLPATTAWMTFVGGELVYAAEGAR